MTELLEYTVGEALPSGLSDVICAVIPPGEATQATRIALKLPAGSTRADIVAALEQLLAQPPATGVGDLPPVGGADAPGDDMMHTPLLDPGI